MRRWLSLTLLLGTLLAATPMRDGATILNSGSTNTPPWTIKLWSDGSATWQIRDGNPTAFTLSKAATERFFTDVKASRDGGRGPMQHCMKSASFGTTTVVQWHGWSSPDLQCPPLPGAVSALAQDVAAVRSAAKIPVGPIMRRFPLPMERRKIPAPTPEVTPT
jgi:hypothetical protein